ncbi:MFS transporter [soil metagenome]
MWKAVPTQGAEMPIKSFASHDSVLQVAAFRRVLAANIISLLGDGVANVAVVVAMVQIGAGAQGLGVVTAARLVPTLVLVLLGGVWADRLARRTLMIASNVARGACQLVLAVLLLTREPDLGVFVMVAVGYGLASAFYFPAAGGILRDCVPQDRLQQAVGYNSLGFSIGSVAGPAVGGVLVAFFGVGWAYAVDATSFALSAVLLLLARVTQVARPTAADSSLWGEVAVGFQAVRQRTWAWSAMLYSAVYQFAVLGVLFVVGPVLIAEEYGGSRSLGLAVAAAGLGNVLGGLLLLRWRSPRLLHRSFVLMLLTAVILVALALKLPFPVVLVGEVLFGLAMAFSVAAWETTLQTHIPGDVLSRVSSYDWLASTALRPLGFLVAGFVSVAVSSTAIFALATVVLLIATAVVLSLRGIRDLPTTPPTPPTEETHECSAAV